MFEYFWAVQTTPGWPRGSGGGLQTRYTWVQIPSPAPTSGACTSLTARRDRWNRLDPETRGRILKVLMALRNRLSESTLKDYADALTRLGLELGTLDNVEATAKAISALKGHRLEASISAYRHYCRIHKLPEPIFEVPKRRHRRPLPYVPSDKVLKASLVIPKRARWRAYFRLLYETGARPSEPFNLRVQDIDFESEKVRLRTLKRGGYTREREIPISPLLAGLLKALCEGKGADDYVFSLEHDPKKPLKRKYAQRILEHVRKVLRSQGYDVRGLRLHAYRHAYATRLYQATKDLALVQRALGHKDLETTMIYLHIQPAQPRLYDVKALSLDDEEGISQAIAEGWEKVLQTKTKIWFRKPRWLP